MYQSQIKLNSYDYSYNYAENYQTNPQQINPIIEGYFPKELSRKDMAIKKINNSLVSVLAIALVVTAISYYFATANEIVLNNLSRQTVILNDENFDLQNKVDKLKSFTNVDMTMQKNNMLQKAQQVIEIPAVSSNAVNDKKLEAQTPFVWAIGY